MSKESVYDILFKKNNVGEPECNKVEARSDIFNMDNKELYTLAPTIPVKTKQPEGPDKDRLVFDKIWNDQKYKHLDSLEINNKTIMIQLIAKVFPKTVGNDLYKFVQHLDIQRSTNDKLVQKIVLFVISKHQEVAKGALAQKEIQDIYDEAWGIVLDHRVYYETSIDTK